MFCKNCGNPLPDGSTHCNLCGAPQQAQAPTAPTTPAAPANNVVPQIVEPVAEKKKNSNAILIAIIAVLAVIIIVIVGIFVVKPAIEGNTSGSSQSEEKDDDDKDEDKDKDNSDKDNSANSGESENSGDRDEDEDISNLTAEEAAVKALDAELKNVRKTNGAAIYEEFMQTGDTEDIPDEAIEIMGDMIEAIVSRFDYEIVSSEQIDDDTVTVTLSVETIDAEKAVEGMYESMFSYIMDNNIDIDSMSEDEMGILFLTILTESFSDPKVGTVQGEAEIEMVLADGKWEIADYGELMNMISGDMDAAMDAASF